jgi:hippurate hydrolase
MLLGAAKLLKEHEEELEGTIKLEFQPAEEIFQGSKDMIEAGLLKNPDVDAAFMMHVVPGLPMPSGMLLMPAGGISMASCEQYHIHVQGKGGHGSMPNACIDPITAAAHIHLALQEISARELDPNGFGVFTTGKFVAGAASNIIPDFADMYGTIRTSDPNNHTGSMIKERMSQIASSVGEAYRCKVDVEFFDYCPCMQIDGDLAADGLKFMQELMPESIIDLSKMTGGKAGGGSEDFAFVSHEVPTLSVLISAGNANEGYCFSQHHPKVIFDDSILAKGSAVYAYMGMRYLQEHHKD